MDRVSVRLFRVIRGDRGVPVRTQAAARTVPVRVAGRSGRRRGEGDDRLLHRGAIPACRRDHHGHPRVPRRRLVPHHVRPRRDRTRRQREQPLRRGSGKRGTPAVIPPRQGSFSLRAKAPFPPRQGLAALSRLGAAAGIAAPLGRRPPRLLAYARFTGSLRGRRCGCVRCACGPATGRGPDRAPRSRR